jgi:HEAT repeat protein
VYFEDPSVAPIIEHALNDAMPDVRAAAARAVGRLQLGEGQPLLRTALAGADPWVRYHAARSADALAGAEVLLPLCKQAEADPHPPARIAAIESLGRLADTVTTRVLEAQVEDPSDEIAVAALESLGRTANPGARGTMVAALRSGNDARAHAALTALSRSGVASHVAADIAYVARHRSEPVAREAIALLGQSEALQEICELAQEAKLRAACIHALADIFERDMAQADRMLDEDDELVRELAIEALGRVRTADVSRRIAHALTDASDAVRATAEIALQRVDLRQMLSSGDTASQRSASQVSDG